MRLPPRNRKGRFMKRRGRSYRRNAGLGDIGKMLGGKNAPLFIALGIGAYLFWQAKKKTEAISEQIATRTEPFQMPAPTVSERFIGPMPMSPTSEDSVEGYQDWNEYD